MLTTPDAVRRRFFWAVGAGAGIVLLILVFVLVRPSFCKPPNNEWAAQSYQYSSPADYGTEWRGQIIARKTIDAASHNDNPYEKYKDNTLEILCGEIKLTDVALALFTYYLVVVGWFTMRNVDETTKRTERAYIVCGGPFGRVKKNTGFRRVFDRMFQEPQRPGLRTFHKANDFTEPWRMALHNFGRTPAFISEVIWGLSPKADFEFWSKTKVEEIIQDCRLLPDNTEWGESRADEAIPPDIAGIPYRHVEFEKDRSAYIDWVFFGRVIYRDIFGEAHSSYFKLLLTKEHSDPFPGCHSEND